MMNFILRVLIIFLLSWCNAIKAQEKPIILQADPPNWWINLKHNRVQIMFSGKDIGTADVKFQYPGISMVEAKKGDSPNYLFVEMEVSQTALTGHIPIQFRINGKPVAHYDYPILKRENQPSKGFNSSDAIYLIVPDRFANGDTGNDEISEMKESKVDRRVDGGRHGGDIKGIIKNIDYLASMGFTALWTTPMLLNDMEGYSYHGYAITDQYRVDPRFGTIDDYKQLSEKASKAGIKIIFDQVLNHIGTNHRWIKDPPFKDWINYLPSAENNRYILTNHQRTVNQDLNASQFDRDLMLHGWFVPSMADLNQRNPEMARYLIQNSIWWIETLRLGGIRQDTYGYSDKEFLRQWTCALMDEYPEFSIVGEEWSTNPLVTSYWQKGKKNTDGYESCLSTIMDFPLQSALVESLLEPETSGFNKGFGRLYETMANDFIYANPNHILVMGDNHDMNRLFMQLNQDKDLVKLAITFLSTVRGIPQIFYGTEILMDNTGHHKVDGLIRSDFPGGWRGDVINAFTGEGLTPDQKEIQEYVKKLLNWRKSKSVIAKGRTMHFVPFDGVYTYFRYDQGDKVMVILNKDAISKTVDLKRFREILPLNQIATNIITGEEVRLSESIQVNAKTALVLQLTGK